MTVELLQRYGALLVLLILLVIPTASDSPSVSWKPGEHSASREEQVPELTRPQEAVASHLAKKYSKPRESVDPIVRAAYEAGDKHDVPPLLVLAVIEKESSLNPSAESFYGAKGLMQVVPRFHKQHLQDPDNPDELFEPQTNIMVGTRILRDYLREKGGNLGAALKRYSGNARKYAAKVASFRVELEAVEARGKRKPAREAS